MIAAGLVLTAAVAGGLSIFGRSGPSAAAMDLTYTTAAVERRDISSSITGSGTLEAANSYSVTALVEGSILTDSFEEGDQVEEGMVLYTIDAKEKTVAIHMVCTKGKNLSDLTLEQ